MGWMDSSRGLPTTVGPPRQVPFVQTCHRKISFSSTARKIPRRRTSLRLTVARTECQRALLARGRQRQRQRLSRRRFRRARSCLRYHPFHHRRHRPHKLQHCLNGLQKSHPLRRPTNLLNSQPCLQRTPTRRSEPWLRPGVLWLPCSFLAFC